MSRLYRLLCIALLVFVSSPALAQYTRDTAANKKIDEAINTHYVATDFEKAEGVLLGTINACGDKCSPQTLGKAWMYVGIVRGSGKNNQAGAKEAFQKAVAADPNVKLDTVLATPETQATFAAIAGGGAPAPAPAAAPPVAAPAAPAAPPPGGGLSCTPSVTNVETRRPIPVQCSSDEDVTSMELKYKSFGSDTWKTMPMQKKGESFRVQLPCTATNIAGALKLYVRAKDAQGEQVDSWGSKQAPIVINLAEKVSEEPPSFDDGEAPARCAAKEECPPDFPGCGGAKGGGEVTGKDWGASCENSKECKAGLLCEEGTCQTAPSCDSDNDCSTGMCVNGKCDIADRGGSSQSSTVAGPYKKNWLALNIGQDIAFVGGYNVCDPKLGQQSDNYACFYAGTNDEPFFHTPYPLRDGISTGAVLATTRILASYDRAFTPRITIGARLGFAFGGGPPAGMQPPVGVTDPPAGTKGTGGTPFLPVHAELRGEYWFLPLTAKTFRAYALVGGGMAQVDAKVRINEYDCEDAGKGASADMSSPDYEPDFNGLNPYEQCRSGKKTYYNISHHQPVPVDGWKKMGQGFVEIGAGGMLAIGQKMGVTLEAKLLYMLPATGVVIEPALGLAYG
ncbi:MAG TPA: dickkopf-related protein, partial [Polyangiaceae bacterium]|nr:dickkopf-related protein [Polyangiaceae bacterium]